MAFPKSFDESHGVVCDLIGDFSSREAFYLSPEYQEAETRGDFIDKFWIALGWDVRHEHQKNPYEQEVKVERSVQVGLAQKKADYAFFESPNWRDARFFCEAKKPSVPIRVDRDAHFQTHRYGWNSSAPLSVLTDFQELVIVDCRRKPDIDAALTAQHKSYHYRDFDDPEKFGEIYWLFSREAVTTGKLDAYIAAMPKLRKVGKQLALLRGGDSRTVDAVFLDDLETYRGDLARMLKNRNPQLDGDTLTELVQRILDRLVFLRFLEDKLIETKWRVHDFSRAAAGQSWAKFINASRDLDTRYNGIVFKKHDLIDGRTFKVDDGDFADLCEQLSHVRSPYDFNAIPVHILGSIYERFLGTVIVTTDKRARPEQKPEVRKAGGVYYTPEYIVRYICEQTVGKLIEGKTPAQIEKLRFADIACGSGSFLLGIFDLLLRYHGRWYAGHPDAAAKENLAPATKNKKKRKEFIPAVAEREGLLCLTLEKKRQILLNNIYGVDLDPQAVEVAQLSLYLKLLEDETTSSTRDDYLDFHEALLPPLGGNIKRGNSLIGTDIFIRQMEFEDEVRLFTDEDERRVRPMDFRNAFPGIMDKGGFDAVIGNPPYFNIDDTWGARDPRLRAIKETFPDVHTDKTDVLFYFLARASRLAKKARSFVGFIVSRAFLEAYKAAKLRTYLSKHYPPSHVTDFRNYHVFEGVGITTAIVILQPAGDVSTVLAHKLIPRELPVFKLEEILANSAVFEEYSMPVSQLGASPWVFASQTVAALDRKLDAAGPALGSVMHIGQGMQTGLNTVFGGRSKSEIEEFGLSNGNSRRRASNSQIHRYRIEPEENFLIFIEDHDHFCTLPEALQRYLSANRVKLSNRAAFKRGDCKWWQYTWPLHRELYGGPKLLCPYLAKENRFGLDMDDEYLGLTDTTVLFSKPRGIGLHYLLGLLNSRLLSFRFQRIGKLKSGGVLEYFWNSISKLPIRALDLANSAQKAQHDRLVKLVDAMLKAKAQVSTAKTDSDRTYLEDKCAGLDRQIDQLVYELYGLTEEEIALVEGT